jgi:DNA-binding MarR family transcriptional regulator
LTIISLLISYQEADTGNIRLKMVRQVTTRNSKTRQPGSGLERVAPQSARRTAPGRKRGLTEQSAEFSPQVLGYLVKSLQHSLRQSMDEAMRSEGLSFAHMATLYSLTWNPGASGAELARVAFVTAQTMNLVLKRMEKDGLISREPHPTNQRAERWYIGSAGTRAMKRAAERCAPVLNRMVSLLSATEAEQFGLTLMRCMAGLDGVDPEKLRANLKSARDRATVRSSSGSLQN